MAISKRTRFEVLRRDNYTCRYCRSEENALTVDHVTPVALGGTDAPNNLVAACRDCNAGKASNAPGEQTLSMLTDAQIAYEKARAVVMAREEKAARAKRKVYKQFLAAWRTAVPYIDPPADWRGSVAIWIGRGMSIERIIDAIHIAGGKTHLPDRAIYPYMAKIVWNWLTELEDQIRAELPSAEVGDDDETCCERAEFEGYVDGAARIHRRFQGEINGGRILRYHIDGMSDRVPEAFFYAPVAVA